MQANVNGNVDVVISNGAYATFRAGTVPRSLHRYGHSTDTTHWSYQAPAPAALSNGATLPSNIVGPSLQQNTPRSLITDFDTTQRTLFNADYNHTFQTAGWHTLKGGVGFQRTVNDINSRYPGGYVYIFWDRTLALGGQPNDRGTYGYYEVNDRGTVGEAGANILSLYVQDQWQIGDRLTLNLGVRTGSREGSIVPAGTPGNSYRLRVRRQDRSASRIRATTSGEMAARSCMRATGGTTIGRSTELARGSFGGDIWCIRYRAIDNPNDPFNANFASAPGRDLWQGGGDCRDRRVPSFDNIDPDLKPMSQDSYSAGFDFEVNPRTVATVHYVHNNLNRTIEDLGILVDGNEVYFIGNPGEGAATMTPTSFSPATPAFATPKPKRQYDAVELGISRRFANRWFGSANLTISRLYGNYAGLASSDEILTPTTGVASCDCTAAGRFHVPPGRQRQPRLGLRRTTVRLTRHARRSRPSRDGSSGRRQVLWRVQHWPATRRSGPLSMPAAARR